MGMMPELSHLCHLIMSDPLRPNKVLRCKLPSSKYNLTLDNPALDHINLLGMMGLILKLKLCSTGQQDKVFQSQQSSEVRELQNSSSSNNGSNNCLLLD
ncbi:hypothetical protein A6R68_19037 [Neotoma lepida]|uniref:Uncharacterized protein n=1 Tax=Neotoma lepida TaxID=56216 RepID=A0A1A6HJ25_NEOLE|nr:hypothetical protein A6R68_19037 [Neotoma lepida]